jgi:hypothetical protein
MTAPSPDSSPTRPLRSWRTWIVRLTIGSFSIAALMGILALVSGFGFGETEAKVLLTTVIVGCASILVLCYLPSAGRWFQFVGVLGGLVVLAGTGLALFLTWSDWDDVPDAVWKSFVIALILAVTLAQACLLLLLAAGGGAGRPGRVPVLLGLTLMCAAVLAAMVILPIIDEGGTYEDTYFRALGVVAILDVLGTVVTAALAKFGGDRASLEVPADLVARVTAYADAHGRTPEDVLRTAVETELGKG